MSEQILIVEDEKIIALDLRRRLEKFGYTVCSTTSRGDESIQLAGQYKPDLILMDIMLEGEMDGITAAIQIKKLYHLPVMFLTAFADQTTLERAKEATPLGYILKPFKERELSTTIEMGLYKNKIDQKLKQQEELFSTILRSVGDSIIATDEHWNIQFINQEAEKLLGINSATAVGQPIVQIVKILDAKSLVPIELTKLLEEVNKDSYLIEYALIETPQGRHIHIEGLVNFLKDTKGEHIGLVCSIKDMTEIKKLSENLIFQSTHDKLTGLINRDSFADKLSQCWELAHRLHQEFSLMYVDVDQFKVVNDSCGHHAGDALLKDITQKISNMLNHGDILARLGGDEFGLILYNANIEAAHQRARKIKKVLNSNIFIWNEYKFPIRVSMGVIPLDPQTGGVHDLLSAVDDACQLAKEEGGNKIRTYNISDDSFYRRRGQMQWVSQLQKSLEEDRFALYFQYIKPLDEAANLPPKAEILIRLKGLEGQIIQPFDFIPAAERYNFMSHIDIWVIQNAFRFVQRYLTSHDEPLVFCINLSGGSLTNENLFQVILDCFKIYEVPPERICFEVTETTAINNLTAANNFIDMLGEVGCTFALDDFGTGFASFSYLRSLHVDFIKIDGSFVKELDNNEVDFATVSAINQIAHAMGKKTIAEYVATQRVFDILKAVHVDYAQGYYLNEPLPIEELINHNFKPSLLDQR